MEILSLRARLGWSLLAFALPHQTHATPPAINSVPLPVRSFPSEEELRLFLEPRPLVAIPDDPPPREGAMFDLPYIIEPPDLILLEVLEALPGRPISGERLVRPDGTISVGFYGNIYIRGLTEEQAKAKILLHLREHVSDEYLGLFKCLGDAVRPSPVGAEAATDPAGSDAARLNRESVQPTEDNSEEARPAKPKSRGKKAKKRSRGRAAEVATTGRPEPVTTRQGEKDPNPSKPRKPEGESTSQSPIKPLDPLPSGFAPVMTVHPADSDRIFLDVTAYNSKNYYILGDVASPGRMPCTGNETVLDALNFARGFLATADQQNIRLIRPARGGKPIRIYQVDYQAITEKGDVTTNYQVFPGDRIVVGRNDVVKKTMELDRLAAPLDTIFNSILKSSFMAKSVKNLGDSALGASTRTEAQHVAILKVWAEFWSKALAEKEGVTFDETRLREALLRALEPAAKGAEETKPQ
ncbi:SLBB domain-containing protein [Singulisphaera sp. Ch08]|uniref:SLBB domain-containing protein n=1 Tax=Singulisphaera sp. Ch08 TaxID=3120278 RepID=A0AAU7CQ80_9BACT